MSKPAYLKLDAQQDKVTANKVRFALPNNMGHVYLTPEQAEGFNGAETLVVSIAAKVAPAA
jgi:hypothetical protein